MISRTDFRRKFTKGELAQYIKLLEEQLHQAGVKFGMIEYNLSLRGLRINPQSFTIEERDLDDPLNASPAARVRREQEAPREG